MMNLWFLISDDARKGLARYYKELSGYDFKPPVLRFPKVIIDPKSETSVKIEQLVRRGK